MQKTGTRSCPAARISPNNRSLERGIEILRAFRPGSDLLGNGELAERTGLPPATVSRLTTTLVNAGFLEYDPARRAYRLGGAVLGLAHSMQTGSPLIRTVSPVLRSVARQLRVNVGLAIADRDDMLYVESIRQDSQTSVRHVGRGHRVPMELTALGHAYLAALPQKERQAVFERISTRRPDWPQLEREIYMSIDDVMRHGFCATSWHPEVIALAAPLTLGTRPPHVINMSMRTQEPIASIVRKYKKPLLALAKQVEEAVRCSGLS